MSNKSTLPWGMIAGIAFAMALGMYFTFAAVQGDYGLFRRAEILNEAAKLETESGRPSCRNCIFGKSDASHVR